MERVPREKEIVLAQKANQEKWYRAVIDSVDCNIVEVTFIDVGGTSILGVEYLKELSPEIRTVNFTISLLHLFGLFVRTCECFVVLATPVFNHFLAA